MQANAEQAAPVSTYKNSNPTVAVFSYIILLFPDEAWFITGDDAVAKCHFTSYKLWHFMYALLCCAAIIA